MRTHDQSVSKGATILAVLIVGWGCLKYGVGIYMPEPVPNFPLFAELLEGE